MQAVEVCKKLLLAAATVVLAEFGATRAAAQTRVLGWPPAEQTALEQIGKAIADVFGATPDTIERTPRQIRIAFTNAPFTPIWFTLQPNGGIVCHDLGAFIERDVAKPIAAYLFGRSPDTAVDTVAVVFHKRTGQLQIGGCSGNSHIRFRPTELQTQRRIVPVR
jgi:hypothetical protein